MLMRHARRGSIVLLAILAPTLQGCLATAGAGSTVPGLLYSAVTIPEVGTSVTANPAGRKVGQATCESILGLIATGDCSVEAAAAAAKITRIHSVARKVENVLGLYAKYTTIVTGE